SGVQSANLQAAEDAVDGNRDSYTAPQLKAAADPLQAEVDKLHLKLAALKEKEAELGSGEVIDKEEKKRREKEFEKEKERLNKALREFVLRLSIAKNLWKIRVLTDLRDREEYEREHSVVPDEDERRGRAQLLGEAMRVEHEGIPKKVRRSRDMSGTPE